MARVSMKAVKSELDLLNLKSKKQYRYYTQYGTHTFGYAVGLSGFHEIRAGLTTKELFDILYTLNAYNYSEEQ